MSICILYNCNTKRSKVNTTKCLTKVSALTIICIKSVHNL